MLYSYFHFSCAAGKDKMSKSEGAVCNLEWMIVQFDVVMTVLYLPS